MNRKFVFGIFLICILALIYAFGTMDVLKMFKSPRPGEIHGVNMQFSNETRDKPMYYVEKVKLGESTAKRSPPSLRSTQISGLEASLANDYMKLIKPDICDVRAIPNYESMQKTNYRIPLTEQLDTNFTMLVLTHNRTRTLIRTLVRCSKMKIIDQIIIYWNNPGITPPDLSSVVKATFPISFYVMPPGNSLRQRFYVSPKIRTQCVYTVDDDLEMNEADLLRGFNSWKKYPWGISGYTPRGHKLIKSETYTYPGATEPRSMILTGAAFFHVEYMRMFNDKLPNAIKSMIDNLTNCEDLAMNFVISSHCQCAHAHGIGAPSLLHHSGAEGLYNRKAHYDNRGVCITELAKYYKPMPLILSPCVDSNVYFRHFGTRKVTQIPG